MVRVLKRTMVLDILVLPPTLGRFEVAKVGDDLYCEDFVVKSVQFTPGKRFHVIFDGPEAKNAAEQLKQATIHGVTYSCLLYTSPSPRDQRGSRMPSAA